MSLLEAGSHTVSGLGSDLFTDVIDGGTATLPCWAVRLAFVRKPPHPRAVALGVALFFLADWRTEEVYSRVGGFIGGDSTERHRAGGALGGLMFHATFGS